MCADMENPELCPRCQSSKVVKNGTRSGRQRFSCRGCSHHFFTAEASRPQQYSAEIKALCLKMYFEKNLNLRQIEDLTGIDHATIFNWSKHTDTSPPLISHLSTNSPQSDF
jgi:transposase-like protein